MSDLYTLGFPLFIRDPILLTFNAKKTVVEQAMNQRMNTNAIIYTPVPILNPHT